MLIGYIVSPGSAVNPLGVVVAFTTLIDGQVSVITVAATLAGQQPTRTTGSSRPVTTPSIQTVASTSDKSSISSAISSSWSTKTSILVPPSSTPPPDADTSRNGLAPGAIAGISIGAVLLLGVIIVLSYLFGYRRSRKNSRMSSQEEAEPGIFVERKKSEKRQRAAELDGTHWKRERYGPTTKKSSRTPSILSRIGTLVGSRRSRAELDGTHWKRELPAEPVERRS